MSGVRRVSIGEICRRDAPDVRHENNLTNRFVLFPFTCAKDSWDRSQREQWPGQREQEAYAEWWYSGGYQSGQYGYEGYYPYEWY